MASEREMRRTIDNNMEVAIEAENVPMSFPNAAEDDEVRLASLVQISDLKEAIFSRLNKHQRYTGDVLCNKKHVFEINFL